MCKKITFFLLIPFSLIMVMNSGIYSQYVIKFPLNIENDLNVIESINLPLIYQTENEIITLVSEEQLNIINAYRLHYLILDKSETFDNYLILSSKQKKPLKIRLSTSIKQSSLSH